MVDVVLTSVNILSVLSIAALTASTTKPCRASNVPYLLAIPVGFGLITIAFLVEVFAPFIISGSPVLGLPIGAVSLLTQTYGVLFLAFAYARRTRFRWIGESTTVSFVAGVMITLALFGIIFVTRTVGDLDLVLTSAQLFMRTMIAAITIYLVYETLRNWRLTHRASEGVVTIGFLFFIVEQLGFALALENFGTAAIFLAYEGRLLGLFLLNAVLYVGVKKGDVLAILKRLGLGAPVHTYSSLTRQ